MERKIFIKITKEDMPSEEFNVINIDNIKKSTIINTVDKINNLFNDDKKIVITFFDNISEEDKIKGGKVLSKFFPLQYLIVIGNEFEKINFNKINRKFKHVAILNISNIEKFSIDEKIKDLKMMGHTNPHHIESVGRHIQICVDAANADKTLTQQESALLVEIAKWHDLGKEHTKAKRFGHYSFINHEFYSSVIYIQQNFPKGEIVEINMDNNMIIILLAISGHMGAHKGKKNIVKFAKQFSKFDRKIDNKFIKEKRYVKNGENYSTYQIENKDITDKISSDIEAQDWAYFQSLNGRTFSESGIEIK